MKTYTFLIKSTFGAKSDPIITNTKITVSANSRSAARVKAVGMYDSNCITSIKEIKEG